MPTTTRRTASISVKNHAKSIQSFMQKIGRHRESKSRSRTGMYKKIHRVIEK